MRISQSSGQTYATKPENWEIRVCVRCGHMMVVFWLKMSTIKSILLRICQILTNSNRTRKTVKNTMNFCEIHPRQLSLMSFCLKYSRQKQWLSCWIQLLLDRKMYFCNSMLMFIVVLICTAPLHAMFIWRFSDECSCMHTIINVKTVNFYHHGLNCLNISFLQFIYYV